ncbi:MAG: DUF58 domain-containing protein [Gammaproteobacteria bacterium]|jgi:uncharacterized protein (DUF58 family)
MTTQPEISAPLLSITELENLQRQTLRFQARQRRPVASRYAGPMMSIFRGRGMELEDLRAYQAGDDVRHMEWRATARSGRPITKVFREERQRLVYLVVDRGPTMAFGTRREIKAATAARVAALLAFSAVARQERVAGLVLNGDGEQDFPPTRNLDGALHLLRAVIAPLAAAPHFEFVSLENLERGVERGSSIYLISDFQHLDERRQPALRHLAERCEVTAIHIVDPAEEQLSAVGRTRFRSPEGKLYVVDTGDVRLRERYAAAMAKRNAALQRNLLGAGVDIIRVHTHEDAASRLEQLLWGI